jgi:hypothetical protein
MRIVDLAFEAGAGPIRGLIPGVEINTAIGMGRGHDVDFEMKVFEWLIIANIEEMAAVTVSDERAIFDFPGVRIFFGLFPAVERFAIEELDKAFFGISGISSKEKLGRREESGGSEGNKQISFHAAKIRGRFERAREKGAMLDAGSLPIMDHGGDALKDFRVNVLLLDFLKAGAKGLTRCLPGVDGDTPLKQLEIQSGQKAAFS